MLHCKDCDYLIQAGGSEERPVCKCSITGMLLAGDPELLDIGYPCRDVSYASISAPLHEALCKAASIDWRVLYGTAVRKPSERAI